MAFSGGRVRASVVEDNGSLAVEQDSFVEVPSYRAGEDATLDVAPFADQVRGRMRMRDVLDVLGDDRPFIEIAGHVMRRRADHLHASRMRLMIGLRALETRQK